MAGREVDEKAGHEQGRDLLMTALSDKLVELSGAHESLMSIT